MKVKGMDAKRRATALSHAVRSSERQCFSSEGNRGTVHTMHKKCTLKRDAEIFKRLEKGEATKEIAAAMHITRYVIYDAKRRRRDKK